MGTRDMGWEPGVWDGHQRYGMDMRVWDGHKGRDGRDGHQGYGMDTMDMG